MQDPPVFDVEHAVRTTKSRRESSRSQQTAQNRQTDPKLLVQHTCHCCWLWAAWVLLQVRSPSLSSMHALCHLLNLNIKSIINTFVHTFIHDFDQSLARALTRSLTHALTHDDVQLPVDNFVAWCLFTLSELPVVPSRLLPACIVSVERAAALYPIYGFIEVCKNIAASSTL